MAFEKRGKRANCTFKSSLRKNQKILFDEEEKQSFKVNKRLKMNTTAYTCSENHCPARIIRNDVTGECFYSNEYKAHNHKTTSERTVAINEFKNTLKKRVQT